MLYCLVATVILNTADAYFTWVALSNGASEMNPLMLFLITLGFFWFFLFKILVVNSAAVILAYLGREYKVAKLGFTLTSIAYLVICVRHVMMLCHAT